MASVWKPGDVLWRAREHITPRQIPFGSGWTVKPIAPSRAKDHRWAAPHQPKTGPFPTAPYPRPQRRRARPCSTGPPPPAPRLTPCRLADAGAVEKTIMTKRMLIDAAHAEETRVVVVDGTHIEEFDFESRAKKQLRGNISLARVTRVEPSLQAAFVEYGGNRHGFLAFNEIHPDYYQIPLADREALMREEAEEEDDHEPRARRRRGAAASEADADAVDSEDDDDVIEEEVARRRRR